MRTTNEILDSIDNRLREVNEEIQTLNAARAALDGREPRTTRRRRPTTVTKRVATTLQSNGADATPPPKVSVEVGAGGSADVPSASGGKARRPAPRKARRKGTRGAEAVPAERLELLLSENGGLTTSALAEQANANRDQVLTLLRKLEQAGRIRRTGQRRGTRWHAITDEDRIRERAAELAARRKRTT
jgi:hypothetical protein